MGKIVPDAETVRGWDEHELYGVLNLITEDIKRRNRSGFAEAVKSFIAEHEIVVEGAEPVAATWRTDHWDNGWFYVNKGLVWFSDGTRVEIDVEGDGLADSITEFSQEDPRAMSRYSVLKADLIKGEVEHLSSLEHQFKGVYN